MAMATSTSHPFSSFSTSIDTTLTFSASASRQCATLRALLPPHSQSQGHFIKFATYGGKVARNVVTMATNEVPTEFVALEVESQPDTLKKLQDTWDKVEDKYAVISLAVAAVFALWVSNGMISAIDRLPLIPVILELVGIGYTAWFVYQNLVYQPQREELLQKVKETYKEISGIN